MDEKYLKEDPSEEYEGSPPAPYNSQSQLLTQHEGKVYIYIAATVTVSY